ncbi:transposase [Streptomyces sp. NPDC006540]|jgi:transposase|uniref:transposase n=1 Tax=Streptomyces sp. NPDC006540 TaxID=3155353 RepID=UPI0033B0F1DE
MGRADFTDEQWAVLEPLLPKGIKAGRPPVWSRRQLIDGIRFRVRTGVPRRDVPVEYGPWGRVYDLFHRWQRDGTWQQILTCLQSLADAKGVITWDLRVDSTVCRAHQHAAGARKQGDLANPKLDEREVLTAMLDREPDAVTDRSGLLLIADKGFASKEFEADLASRGAELLRPSFKREKRRKGESLLKSVRQLIESVNDTLKGQLDLEQHGGRTFEGVAVRVAQRVLALAAAIWHNHKTGQPVIRSLIAYDH